MNITITMTIILTIIMVAMITLSLDRCLHQMTSDDFHQ